MIPESFQQRYKLPSNRVNLKYIENLASSGDNHEFLLAP
jgi:hypothetical protein